MKDMDRSDWNGCMPSSRPVWTIAIACSREVDGGTTPDFLARSPHAASSATGAADVDAFLAESLAMMFLSFPCGMMVGYAVSGPESVIRAQRFLNPEKMKQMVRRPFLSAGGVFGVKGLQIRLPLAFPMSTIRAFEVVFPTSKSFPFFIRSSCAAGASTGSAICCRGKV
jgi:hypothetical protein